MAEILTCLMTVCNENIHILVQSIESILNQTFKDFVFLIIIDNPQNISAIQIIEKYKQQDKRIYYIINDQNLGLPLSLNKGIESIQTKYIARMDADDISLPMRFEKQLQYLEAHSKTDVIGSFCYTIDEENNCLHKRMDRPSKSDQINLCMKYMNVFVHPTLMGKTLVFKELQYRELLYSQDYDFTCRLIERGYKIENFPEELLLYRITKNSSDQKLALKRITYCTIQKHYRKKELNNSDIVFEINKITQSESINKIAKAIQQGNNILEKIRSRKLISGFFLLLDNVLFSKYQRQYWMGIIHFRLIMKKYIKNN